MVDQRFVYPDWRANPSHTGRVSIANGDMAAAFTGTALAGRPWAGSEIYVLPATGGRFSIGVIAESEDPEYANDELPLTTPWNGDDLTNEKFEIVFGPAFANAPELSAVLSRFRANLQHNAGLSYDKRDIDDYALIQPNSLVWDEEFKLFKQWRDGVLTTLEIDGLGGRAYAASFGATLTVGANELLPPHCFVADVAFPTNFVGSHGFALNPAEFDAILPVKKNDTTQVGEVTFLEGVSAPTFESTAFEVVPGDFLTVRGPGVADVSLANFGVTFLGAR